METATDLMSGGPYRRAFGLCFGVAACYHRRQEQIQEYNAVSDDPKKLIAELQFYHLGWYWHGRWDCDSRGDVIFMAPSGVQKERINPKISSNSA